MTYPQNQRTLHSKTQNIFCLCHFIPKCLHHCAPANSQKHDFRVVTLLTEKLARWIDRIYNICFVVFCNRADVPNVWFDYAWCQFGYSFITSFFFNILYRYCSYVPLFFLLLFFRDLLIANGIDDSNADIVIKCFCFTFCFSSRYEFEGMISVSVAFDIANIAICLNFNDAVSITLTKFMDSQTE